MRVDALAVSLRTRGNMEAADLGVRLCQHAARSVFRCYLPIALPVFALCLAAFELAPWLPTLAIWCAKPWLDRAALFALSRAAFGQKTTFGDLWREQRRALWSQFFLTWTWRRLSPWRSLTQPTYQLEGLSGSRLRKRVRQVRAGKAGAGAMMTSAFATVEFTFTLALLSLLFWLAPKGMAPDVDLMLIMEGQATGAELAYAVAYAMVVAFLEPFYVAAGFGMYLNRRVELEAWDIEQEFRRAFAE
jgi:hypothetical protein